MTISFDSVAICYIVGAAVTFIILIAAWTVDDSGKDRTNLVMGFTLVWPITLLILAGVLFGVAMDRKKS